MKLYKVFRSIIFLFMLFLPTLVHGERIKIASIKYYSRYFFTENHKGVLYKIGVLKDKVKYLKSFWKVYYDSSNKVIVEEYYKNWKLLFYYIYSYDRGKTHKRGFMGYGITSKAHFRIFNRYIWQGYFYKSLPFTWWVYNKAGKLITKTYYKWQSEYKTDYTDKYIYNKDGYLVKTERYREGIIVKGYVF